ncbi:MAG: hypothetical protein V4732_10390 [Pseudomonadota bacterium]
MKNSVQNWHIPLSQGHLDFKATRDELAGMALAQEDVPLIIQLVENPRFDLPGIDIFNGATSLDTHDHIHILLGRGLLPADEAFVIGFTMGSTNRVTTTEEKIYSFFAKYLYPKHYRFDDETLEVFRDAVRLGYVSDCTRLDQVDYTALYGLTIEEARAKIGIETDLLQAYYRIEKKRYPENFAARRL